MSIGMKRFALISAVVFGLAASAGSSLAAKCPAEAMIMSAGNAFASAARARSPQAFTNAAGRYADLRGLAMFALGSKRKSLPPGKEALYVARAKQYVGEFMAKYADRFTGGLVITSCNANIVSAKMNGGGTLTFRVRGASRIDDVSFSGIWMTTAMRDKFVGVINNNGGDVNALIDYLGKY